MVSKITPVILSGGQGTRLWPLSRKAMPKQFIPLLFGQSLFEQTLERVSDQSIFSKPVIICAKDHRFLVRKIVDQKYPVRQIIAEPFGRNTAPALCAAALCASSSEDGNDPLLLVLPSDHYIPDKHDFISTIQKAVSLAEGGAIVVFGIKPHAPHTGFGYIEKAEAMGNGFRVKKFHEKPKYEVAKSYLDSGDFFWNAGIFLVKASIYREQLLQYRPDIFSSVEATMGHSEKDLNDLVLDSASFEKVPDVSIDVAVMEVTDKACVIPAQFKWDDLGSWDALWNISDKDENGNVVQGDAMPVKTTNSYLRTDGPLLCTAGVDNIIAIVEQGSVFIGSRENSEQIKDLIVQLKNEDRQELLEGNFVYRPWGFYEVLIESENFKVKRIGVSPGQRLSLQSHKFRSEHWIVVRGTAHVVIDDKTFEVTHNQSTYIPQGAVHRLENRYQEDLEIIEVQTGTYLGEDDIVRLQDDYRRIES